MTGPGFPEGMRPPRPPVPREGFQAGQGQSALASDLKPAQETILQEWKEKIKEEAKKLGYVQGQPPQEGGATVPPVKTPQQTTVPATAAGGTTEKKAEVKIPPSGHKVSEEEKTDETDELADFFSKFVFL